MFKRIKMIGNRSLKKSASEDKSWKNRGAALVSVLIAITFIAIIATSLLYMVYMNYLAKAMRHKSTDNFYTAEFALDDLSSELQQVAVDQGLAGKNISDAIKKIRSEVGASGNPSRYDNDKVADLIKVASQEADITVDTSYATGYNYEETGSTVKLKGVVITSTDEKGYVSTITSDVIIKFSPSGTGDLDICDFSVLTDNPVYVGGGDSIVTGCVYAQRNKDGNVVGGVPAGDCLYIGNGACMQMLSERAILNGNVEVTGNSVLTIGGKVYVMGDIKLSANSTLEVTGELKLTGHVTGSGKILKKASDSIEEGWTYPGGDKCPLSGGSSKDGLVTQLFCSKVVFYNSYSGPYKWDDFDFNQFFNGSEDGRKDYSNSYGGETLKFQLCSPDVNNSAFNNTLGLMPNKECYINGTCTNSTIVSLNGYRFNGMSQTTPTYMQKMNQDQYEHMLNMCLNGLKRADGGGQYKHANGSNLGGVEMKGPGGTTFYSGSMTVEMPYTCPSGFSTYTYSYNSDPRTLYYNSTTGECYMPVKYLLDDNTSAIITDIFDSFDPNSDPKKSTAIYENWSKE